MNPDVLTERARAERLLDELEADAKTLRGQLVIATRAQAERNFMPLYFDRLKEAQIKLREALAWSYRPTQSAAAKTY